MARPYSMDLRDRVVAAVKTGGMSCRQAAAHYGVGVSTVIRWLDRVRATGNTAPGQMGGHKPKKLIGVHRDRLIERCRASDFTLRGLVGELAERGLKADYRSVWAFVHAEDLSFKKTLVAAEQDRPDVARRRDQWRRHQHRVDPARLVFIDETWTKTNMAPLRGGTPRGARLRSNVPWGHWNTMTFIAALRVDRIDAPWLLDGPINSKKFLAYVTHELVPTLSAADTCRPTPRSAISP